MCLRKAGTCGDYSLTCRSSSPRVDRRNHRACIELMIVVRLRFQAIPAGRLSGTKMELALASEDNSNNDKLNSTDKPQDVFIGKLVGLMLRGVKKYREMKDNTKSLARFLKMSSAEECAKVTEIMGLLKSRWELEDDQLRTQSGKLTHIKDVPQFDFFDEIWQHHAKIHDGHVGSRCAGCHTFASSFETSTGFFVVRYKRFGSR